MHVLLLEYVTLGRPARRVPEVHEGIPVAQSCRIPVTVAVRYTSGSYYRQFFTSPRAEQSSQVGSRGCWWLIRSPAVGALTVDDVVGATPLLVPRALVVNQRTGVGDRSRFAAASLWVDGRFEGFRRELVTTFVCARDSGCSPVASTQSLGKSRSRWRVREGVWT